MIRFDPEKAELFAIQQLTDLAGKDVLEIGCGDGRFTARYVDKAASILAIDPNVDDIAKANAWLPENLLTTVTFLAADMTTFDLHPHAYDVALFSWSM